MVMQLAVLPDGHTPTVTFTVHAQLFSPKVNEKEMGAALFTKNGGGRNFDFDSFIKIGERRTGRSTVFYCQSWKSFI